MSYARQETCRAPCGAEEAAREQVAAAGEVVWKP
jgi:hypothetical protein